MPAQIKNGQRSENDHISDGIDHKSRYADFHIRLVGAHSQTVNGVGIIHAVIVVGHIQPENTSGKRYADRNGKGADHQREEELHTADCHCAQRAAEKPLQGFPGKRALDSGERAADKKQCENPEISENRHPYRLRQLTQIKAGKRQGRGQKTVPVVAGVFQPPEIGAVRADQCGHEQVAEKKRVLAPQTVPFRLQDFYIQFVVHRAEEGRNHGECVECQPYRASFQL